MSEWQTEKAQRAATREREAEEWADAYELAARDIEQAAEFVWRSREHVARVEARRSSDWDLSHAVAVQDLWGSERVYAGARERLNTAAWQLERLRQWSPADEERHARLLGEDEPEAEAPADEGRQGAAEFVATGELVPPAGAVPRCTYEGCRAYAALDVDRRCPHHPLEPSVRCAETGCKVTQGLDPSGRCWHHRRAA